MNKKKDLFKAKIRFEIRGFCITIAIKKGDMSKFLLVNPWITDFSLYDFGQKPYGLLKIASHLRAENHEITFLDCLEGCAKNRNSFGLSKVRKEACIKPTSIANTRRPYFKYGISENSLCDKLASIKKPDAIYLTSGMTYWYGGLQKTIKILRRFFPKTNIILGGIYATLCHHHATRYSGADHVWKGDYFAKKNFRSSCIYPAYDLLENKDNLPIRLTKGCPYKCSYCASRMLSSRFTMRDPVDLFEEVMYYYRTFKTKNFAFYDDALTFNREKGIKKFLRMILASDADLNFHTPNGLHAKYIDYELACLFKKTNFRDIRVSLETADENIQFFTGNKVSNNDLKKALRNLKEAGFSKKDIGIYLLIGAPWLDIQKTMSDVMFINSLNAKAVLASYSPIPGTQDYKALLKTGIITPDTDPLWHNKTIFPELLSPSYTNEIRRIRRFTAKLNRDVLPVSDMGTIG